jgi:hypothetical protein
MKRNSFFGNVALVLKGKNLFSLRMILIITRTSSKMRCKKFPFVFTTHICPEVTWRRKFWETIQNAFLHLHMRRKKDANF